MFEPSQPLRFEMTLSAGSIYSSSSGRDATQAGSWEPRVAESWQEQRSGGARAARGRQPLPFGGFGAAPAGGRRMCS